MQFIFIGLVVFEILLKKVCVNFLFLFSIVKVRLTGVFIIFTLKHRLLVITINVLSKNKRKILHLKIYFLTDVKIAIYCICN